MGEWGKKKGGTIFIAAFSFTLKVHQTNSYKKIFFAEGKILRLSILYILNGFFSHEPVIKPNQTKPNFLSTMHIWGRKDS